MKHKATTFFLGLCLAILAVAASPASAQSTRSVPAFESFHVWSPSTKASAALACLNESKGAVINNCKYQLIVAFDLPIDNQGVVHTVKAQNYVNSTGTVGATCTAWTYDGDGHDAEGTSSTFNPNGAQTLPFTAVPIPDTTNTITLFCALPVGEGIAALTWNP
ncbi:MAG: hypothetical protein ABSD75_16005 [Terriglobales bacterium]|jgi:hypothetical protein